MGIGGCYCCCSFIIGWHNSEFTVPAFPSTYVCHPSCPDIMIFYYSYRKYWHTQDRSPNPIAGGIAPKWTVSHKIHYFQKKLSSHEHGLIGIPFFVVGWKY
jgi:hypothetical protein